MDDPVFKEVNDCFKGFIESSISNLSREEMEASKGEISAVLESYAHLLNHHDLTCKAVDKVGSFLNSKQCDINQFDADQMFKDELKSLQSTTEKKKKNNPCKELHKLLNQKGNDEELEVVMTGTGVHLDPFTQKPIEQPSKSTKCNHMFDYRTINRMFSHLKGNKRTLKCPHIGCVAVLTIEDIKEL